MYLIAFNSQQYVFEILTSVFFRLPRYFIGLNRDNTWRRGPLPGADFDGTTSNLRSEAKQVHTLMFNRTTDSERAILLKKKPDGATVESYAQWITGMSDLTNLILNDEFTIKM